jgi:lactoylglutathione lyase
LAVTVEDVEAEHARLTEKGLNPRQLVDFQNNGVPVAKFFFIADPDGYQIEVLQRGGRFK